MANRDKYNISVDGTVLVTFNSDSLGRATLKIDRNEIETTTYSNGNPTTVLDPNTIVSNGCPSLNMACVLGDCYSNLLCDCPVGTYCEIDDTVQNRKSTKCVSNATCAACSGSTKYCKKKTGGGVECIATKQPFYNLCTGTCTCQANEEYIDGRCRRTDYCFKTDNDSMYVFCGDDEECHPDVLNDNKNACFKKCKPSCELKYTCKLVGTDRAMSCVINDKKFVPQTVITACDTIANCASSVRLNLCDQCNPGFAFVSTMGTDSSGNPAYIPDYLTCVSTQTYNCFAVTLNGGVYECVKCNTGFTLTNGICLTTVMSCVNYDADGLCRYCDLSYDDSSRILVYAFYDSGACTNYPTTDVDLPVVVKHNVESMNCKYFDNVIAASPAVQSLRAGMSQCKECKEGFFVNGDNKCLPDEIDNCLTYSPDSEAGSIWCIECDIGYRQTREPGLVQGSKFKTCITNTPNEITEAKYLIPKCKLYNYQIGCAVCEDGYIISQTIPNIFGQSFFCFLDAKDGSCALTDEAEFRLTGNLKCAVCKQVQGKYAYPAVSSQKICVEIPYKPQCAKHVVNIKTDSTLMCDTCTELFYVNTLTNMCVPRTVINVDRCIKYYKDQDACENYSESTSGTQTIGAALATDVIKLLNDPPITLAQKMSVDFGGWIMGCAVYKDEKTCAKCYSGKYLNEDGFDYNTVCKTVKKIVDNCKYYNKDGITCDECESSYILKDNVCRLVTVENCDDPLAVDTCSKCPWTHPYRDRDNNCTKAIKNPWCYKYSEITGPVYEDSKLECDICEEGYYRNDSGFCMLLETEILNCKYYSGKTLCMKCQDGFYLDYEGKRCLINPDFDENCSEFEYNTECSVCDFGYYLNELGACTPCGNKEGCAFCDQTNTNRCVMCKFGYTHNGTSCEATKLDDKPDVDFTAVEYMRFYNYFPKTEAAKVSSLKTATSDEKVNDSAKIFNSFSTLMVLVAIISNFV